MGRYSIIEQAIRQHTEFLDVGNNVTESEVRHAIRWVMRDNPDITGYAKAAQYLYKLLGFESRIVYGVFKPPGQGIRATAKYWK